MTLGLPMLLPPPVAMLPNLLLPCALLATGLSLLSALPVKSAWLLLLSEREGFSHPIPLIPLLVSTCNSEKFFFVINAHSLFASFANSSIHRLHKIGARVTKGTEIATLFSNISLEVCERAAQRLLDCVRFADTDQDITVPQLIRCVVDKNGVADWTGY